MKIAIVVLLAIALVLVWLLNEAGSKNSQLQSQITELTSRLGDKTKRDLLDLQQKCALQAESMFRTQVRARSPHPQKNETDEQRSHYNAKLNKCFMEISTFNSTSDFISVTRGLVDAIEMRDYGNIALSTTKGETKIHLCTLTPSSGNERVCKSEEEYKAFVATYME